MLPQRPVKLDARAPTCAVICARGTSQTKLVRSVIDRLPGNWDIIVACAGGAGNRLKLPSHVTQIAYDDPVFSGKTIAHNLALQLALARDRYKYIYVSMQDVLPRDGCLETLQKEMEADDRIGMAAPTYFTGGQMNWDGQWPFMETCWVFNNEYLACLLRVQALRDVGGPDNFKTGYATAVEWPMRFWKLGWRVRKIREAEADHLGPTTFGAAPGADSRNDYVYQGITELGRLMARYAEPDDFLAELDRELWRIKKLIPDWNVERLREWIKQQCRFLGINKQWEPYESLTPEQKKIQIVWWARHQGGVETLFSSLAREFIDKGHAVEILHWDQRPPSELYDGIPCRNLGAHSTELLTRAYFDFRPDVVIYYMHAEASQAAFRWPARVIEFVNGHDITDQILKHQAIDRSRHTMVHESTISKKLWEEHPSFKPAHHVWIPNPVSIPNDPWPTRQELDLPEDKLVLVRVGRMVRWKGPEQFIEIVRALKDRVYGVWIGGPDDEPGYESELYEKSAGLPIRWTGNVNDRQLLFGYLQGSDLALIPSTGQWEGISNFALEAMAVGTPVISTAGGYLAEVVITDRTGILLDQNAPPEKFVETIKGLTSEKIQDLSEGASRFMAERYSPQNTVDRWLQLIGEEDCVQ